MEARSLPVNLPRIRIEVEAPRDDVFGDRGNGTVVGERVRTEPDQSLSETDAELDSYHPARLVDDEPQVGTGLDLGGELAGRCVRLQGEQCPGGDIGHNQCVRVLVVSERARRVTVKPQRAQADCTYPKREAEHGSSPGPEQNGRERRPAYGSRVGQVGFDDGVLQVVGIDARSFAERVLRLLHQDRYLAGGAPRPQPGVVGHEHDHCSTRNRDRRAHPAELRDSRISVTADQQQGQDAGQPLSRHLKMLGDRAGQMQLEGVAGHDKRPSLALVGPGSSRRSPTLAAYRSPTVPWWAEGNNACL